MTVAMDTGNTCGCCRGYVETFVTVAMDMGDNCDRCHGYTTTFLTVGHCYGGTLLIVAMADE